ncbi:M28 family metallopeptidase [Sandaracinobacteroides saxicola]|uniref:M20/M25/M40 family metallo-hydrolase n=1 Tax=Sandaracinobacteroides saxicola TaxID=2759707 RepID=A0A7G5ILL3_9SPHN|nr:M28 family metallopeptidase [Sandaracinobacteroides saxicola]QMW24255.1 M20/M25/M40 family metallo-hydrolase [Sandaracinobacteroides saxicola]
MMRVAVVAALLLLGSAVTAAEPRFAPEAFKAHVSFLADDLLEGRDTGARGHAIAAAYVATQMAGLGLRPGGAMVDGKRGWFQPVPLLVARLGPAGSSLTVEGPDGARRWANGSEAIVPPSLVEAEQRVAAPLVFAGFGLVDRAMKLDDYRGLDVRGKIVVLLSGTPKGMQSEIAAHLGATKGRMAMARGAVGVITVNTLEGQAVRPWAVLVDTAASPRFGWVQADGRPYEMAPRIRVGALVSPVAAEALFAGAPRPLAAVLAEADRVGGRPKGFALKTRAVVERQSRFTRLDSPNVVGMIAGSDPVLRDEVVVLSAHLDHIDVRAGKKPDGIYNGALDNAAGIATMLEVARAFRDSGEAPKRTLLFLAVTAEERGLLGARYFAANPTVPIGGIAAVVNLDMPLLLYPFTDVVAFGAERSTMGPLIAGAARAAGLVLSPDPMPEQGLFTRSDHYAFVEKGVPSVFFATGFANGGAAAWADFLKTHYHQPSDDLNRPIDWGAAAKFAEVNWQVVRALADAPVRTRWMAGDYFGETLAGGAPKATKR